MHITRIPAHLLLDLRHEVLREGRPKETAHFTGDDDPGTTHWGAYEGDRLVGCASLMRAPCPDKSDVQFQLRGMAVSAEFRGQGYGRALLEVMTRALDLPIWCNARSAAVGFYASQGWKECSSTFNIEGVGPHRRMIYQPSSTEFTGPYLTMKRAGRWQYVTRPNASGVVAVVALTKSSELVLVQQWRPPVGRMVLELPAGLAGDAGDPAESFELAARRELEEEAGYTGGHWKRLGRGPSSAGMSDEVIEFFYAQGVEKTHAGGGVDSEEIRVHLCAPKDLAQLITSIEARGGLVDPKVMAALGYLSLHGAPLF